VKGMKVRMLKKIKKNMQRFLSDEAYPWTDRSCLWLSLYRLIINKRMGHVSQTPSIGRIGIGGSNPPPVIRSDGDR